jgi:hypothetical protein
MLRRIAIKKPEPIAKSLKFLFFEAGVPLQVLQALSNMFYPSSFVY